MSLRRRWAQACGTASQYQSDVEFWIFDAEGLRGQSVVVHLACQ